MKETDTVETKEVLSVTRKTKWENHNEKINVTKYEKFLTSYIYNKMLILHFLYYRCVEGRKTPT